MKMIRLLDEGAMKTIHKRDSDRQTDRITAPLAYMTAMQYE